MTHKTARTKPKASGYEARPRNSYNHAPQPTDAAATLPQLLAYDEAASLLGLTGYALRSMVARNQVPADCIVKIGTRVRFKEPALAAWIDRLSRGDKEAA